MHSTPYNYFSLLLFAIIATLSGCAQAPEDSGLSRIKIPDRTDADLYLADMAESVQRVQLETRREAFLTNVFDVKMHQEKLFVSDGNKVCVFDTEGNFLQVLGQKGDGPGEYRRVNSMAIDDQSGLIYVASVRKLLVYSSDLELVKERPLPVPTQYLNVIDQKPMLVSEKIGVKVAEGFANQTVLYELNTSLELTDSIPVRTVLLDKVEVGGYPHKHYLSSIGEGMFLYKPVLTPENILRDTLYQVRDNALVPFVRFAFERPQSLNERGFQSIIVQNIINSSSYLICEYFLDWERMLFLYDKKTSNGYHLSKGPIDEMGDPALLMPLDLANDLFYYVKKTEFEDRDTEELNPMIGIVKLK